MNQPATVATWEVLKKFGFTPDAEVISDEMPGLSFDFGNSKLSASAVLGKYFHPVVLFTGYLATPRSLVEVCFELPRMVATRELLAAFLVYYLDKAAGRNGFDPKHPVDWIAEGRANRSLLPWEVDRAAYQARPHCQVRRDWLRLALINLKAIIATTDDTAAVEFSFDGAVLTIRCSGQAVPMPATGKAWSTPFEIPSGKLRRLPKRLMQDEVEVSVYGDELRIGRNCYGGVKEKAQVGAEDPPPLPSVRALAGSAGGVAEGMGAPGQGSGIVAEDESEEPVIAHWPSDWPGRQFVNLDCVGDPGDWIDLEIPSAEEVLFYCSDDRESAIGLADAYIAAAGDLHFPVPTDFGMSKEAMREIAIEDFVGFIREWRNRSIAEREKIATVSRAGEVDEGEH